MSILRKNVNEERLKEFFRNAYWYHTYEIDNGIITDGTYDLRTVLPAHRFPETMTGKTVLDVGSSDGFYAFEFEKRGAESVLAVDTNAYDGSLPFDPSPAKKESYINKHSRERMEFEKYRDIFSLLGLEGSNKLIVLADYWNSAVTFQQRSIYDLEKMEKQFDFVFCGALMEHLKNPLCAIEQLRSVTREICVITLSSALPISKGREGNLRLWMLQIFIRLMGLNKEVSVNERDFILKYVGNNSGGSFYNIHPSTFREMLLAADFKRVEIVGEYDVLNRRNNVPNHNVVFHCFV